MKCVLHIGTEKTGTTLLQEWLYENQSALSRQGVAMSDIISHPNNRKFVSYVHGGVDDHLNRQGIFSKEERDAFFVGFQEEFAAEIAQKSKSHHTFLITSEHFHSRLFFPNQVARVKEFLAPLFDEFRVVCYFREQSQKRTSLFSTGLKSGATVALEAFHNKKPAESHQFNYLLSFEKWEAVFGKDALVPCLYDRETMEGGDIRHDFLKRALPGVDPKALTFTADSANMSLSADEARLFQAANAARPIRIGKIPDAMSAVLRNLIAHLPFLDRSQKIRDPRQREMYDLYHDCNVAFFRRYFGSDGNLFKPPHAADGQVEDEPKYTLGDFAEFVQRISSLKNLVFVNDHEVDALHALAMKLYRSDAITASEAMTLLSIAQRARPDGQGITENIEEIWPKQ